MPSFRFSSVRLAAMGVHFGPTTITSAELEDRVAPLYKRLGIPFGTLERLSGIKTRTVFPHDVRPSAIGLPAARQALAESGIAKERIGALFNCSVARDFFEPATACIVHEALDIPESSMVMDVTNACLGFSDGITLLSQLIENRVVEAGILVSGETIGKILETSIETLLRKEDLTRDDLIRMLPTFTLGSCGVAWVLCHESVAPHGPKILASSTRSGTKFHRLCVGNGDFSGGQGSDIAPLMNTEAAELIAAGADVGSRTWPELSDVLGWKASDIDHLVSHQVGKQLNEAFFRQIGLDNKKEFVIYPRYGNLVSAALPAAVCIGAKEVPFKKGAKVLLTGFGSGLNTFFTGMEW